MYSSVTARDALQHSITLKRPLDSIYSTRMPINFSDYDFSKMTDTKGGFLTADDGSHKELLSKSEADADSMNVPTSEWERQKTVRTLQSRKAGPFEPAINVLRRDEPNKQCRECKSLEIDWMWEEILKCAVCNTCKERYPEKYSLLTKTEVKDDYLLTDRK